MTDPPKFEAELPSGGTLELASADEVDVWKHTAERYIQDYGLVKQNDLVLLGAILAQAIAMYRAQRDLIDPKKAGPAQGILIKAATEIRELEKALGIDKKTREAGGQHTVSDYITRLKRAAHEKGVHIADRVKAYEAFAMELRWRLRLLENGDDEDRKYHDVSEKSICEFAARELAKIEEADKAWAKEKGKVFVGRL